jgi:hypothetical protein
MDADRSLLFRHPGRSAGQCSTDALPALRQRPLRGGLPGRSNRTQPGRVERYVLQSLCWYAVLRQQLPYKVRRFNYFDFRVQVANGYYYEDSFQLLHNPEVTVRSRGVMEKCTFCVQRISEEKDNAKEDRREVGWHPRHRGLPGCLSDRCHCLWRRQSAGYGICPLSETRPELFGSRRNQCTTKCKLYSQTQKYENGG